MVCSFNQRKEASVAGTWRPTQERVAETGLGGGRVAARPCADLARVLGLFSVQWEAAEGFEGYLSGEVKQFLIHFSLFMF